MGEHTTIAWTDKTWNCWQGCHKVSAGCAHCYMFSEKIRYGQQPNVVVRSKPATFNAPLKWKEPARVFTCSWSDWFIAEADAWRDEAWEIVRRTSHLTYQILTKRPERIAGHLPAEWPLPNVWLGTSVEDQAAADERIPRLLATPAALRFLSCEPLLGPVRLPCVVPPHPGLAWVIVGGESGARARPCAEEWVRSLVDQCRRAGLPCFVKQLGSYVVSEERTAPAEMVAHPERLRPEDRAPSGEVWAWRAGLRDRKGGDPAEWPEDLRVREFPEVRRAP